MSWKGLRKRAQYERALEEGNFSSVTRGLGREGDLDMPPIHAS
jgi:hypothetical protein